MRSIELNSSKTLSLEPGAYEFRILNLDDHRPEPEWAVLIGDEAFGIPMKNLRGLDKVAKSVEATDRDGRSYFDE